MANYITQIKVIQKKLGLSQREIAQRVGVTVVAVNRWANANAIPRKRHVKKIERLYKLAQNQNRTKKARIPRSRAKNVSLRAQQTRARPRTKKAISHRKNLKIAKSALANNPLIKYFRSNLKKYKDRQKESIFG